jgi:hypothetical protein
MRRLNLFLDAFVGGLGWGIGLAVVVFLVVHFFGRP